MSLTSFIAELESTRLIKVSGEQKEEYLHGQITVATNNFEPSKARLAAHCDFKGKMFSLMTVSVHDSGFHLSMHKDAAQASLAQLKKYGVFSKVDITIDSSLKIYGGYGQHAFDELKVLFPELSNDHLHASSNQFGQVICFNDSSVRYLCYLTEVGQARLKDILDGEHLVDEQHWQKLEIEAGIANIQSATMSEFVPQMLNLHTLNGIDFDKGCYMGQEVVARTKFLGKNKRATYYLRGKSDQAVTLGTAGSIIEIQLGENWRRGGVINRLCKIDSEIHMLAVMANDTQLGSVARFKDSNIELQVQPLPYEID